jgi:DNA invertase Pin-like site-specific DNA recombinase
MIKEAIGYLRASTDENKQKNSIATQKRSIEAFAALNGYTIAVWTSEYASGGNDDRKGFRDALRLSEERGYYLIAAKADRLSRSLSVWTDLDACRDRLRIAELGDEVVSQLHLSLLLVMSQNERSLIAQRVRDSYQHLKAIHGDDLNWGNKNLGTYSHMGIAKIKENSKNHNDKIKTLVNFVMSDGGSIQDAVEYLNSLNMKTRRGKSFSYKNLYRILRS